MQNEAERARRSRSDSQRVTAGDAGGALQGGLRRIQFLAANASVRLATASLATPGARDEAGHCKPRDPLLDASWWGARGLQSPIFSATPPARSRYAWRSVMDALLQSLALLRHTSILADDYGFER